MCICCRGKAFHYQDEDLDWAKEVDALHFPHDYWSMVYDPHLPLRDHFLYDAFDVAVDEEAAEQQLESKLRAALEDRRPAVCAVIPTRLESLVHKCWPGKNSLHYRCNILRVSRATLAPCKYTYADGAAPNTRAGDDDARAIVVERARPDDIDDILRLNEAPATAISRRKYLEAMLAHPAWPALVIRDDGGRVAGVCVLHRDGRVLGALAVDETFRGRGYARALVHATCIKTWEQRDQNCRETHCYEPIHRSQAGSRANSVQGQGQSDAAIDGHLPACDWLYAITSHTNSSSLKCLKSLGFEAFPGTYDWWERGP